MNTTSVTTGKTPTGLGAIISLGVLTLLFGFAGCVSPRMANKTISIDSDPSGVRVEVNGEDLGRTPTNYTVRSNEKGDFAGGWGDSPSVVFVAFPPDGVNGLYKQTKIFSPSAFMDRGDRVPERIFFDLHRESNR